MNCQGIIHDKPYSWFIFPGALVRNRLPKFIGRGILCIGPTRNAYSDPEWTAIAPVLTPVVDTGEGRGFKGINFPLISEALRIRQQFNLDLYGVTTKYEIPFTGTIDMRIPTDPLCKLMVQEINDDPQCFNEWLRKFAESNRQREFFTDAQKEVLQRAGNEYDFDCLKGRV